MFLKIIIYLILSLGAQVHLDVTPSEIKAGCTDVLTITCTFSKDTTSISYVSSVLLSHKQFSSNASYEDVASIFEYDNQVQTHSNQENITVSGQILEHSVGNLTVHWKTPTQNQSGDYKCMVHGIDQVGHSIVIFADANVSFSIPQTSDTDPKITELGARLDRLDAHWTDINNGLLARIGALEDNLQQVESILFTSNTTHQSHRYFLSRYSYRDIDLGMATCHQFGSHLLEIDDQREYDAIVSFLSGGHYFDGVFVSGSDARDEGHWSFQRTGNAMAFTPWAPNSPSDSERENCALLWRSTGWKMVDDPCYDNNLEVHVICEKSL
ncbi:unnamed protein product [Lymnaea stagnalis]|uniref:C-type lectin domain-containing protein n=1 Tax=Lymnaea stagnalis TaxID=6523 RepID=A0AAV2HNH6_LYMST